MLFREDEINGENLRAIRQTAKGAYWEEERLINRHTIQEVLRQQEQVSKYIRPTGVETLHPGQAPVARPTIGRVYRPLVRRTDKIPITPFRPTAPPAITPARKRNLIDRFFDWVNSKISIK